MSQPVLDEIRSEIQALHQAGLIEDASRLIKILGPGQLDKKLTVVAHKFSASATKCITDAGGKAQTVT